MIRDTGAWYSWRRWYCIKIPLSKAIRIFSGSLFFYWRFLEQIIIVYLLHNFSRTARHPEAVVGRELGGSSLLDPNLRSNLVAEEEVVDPVSQPVLIVFDKCSCNTKADHLPWSLSLDPCPLSLDPCSLILVPWSLSLDPYSCEGSCDTKADPWWLDRAMGHDLRRLVLLQHKHRSCLKVGANWWDILQSAETPASSCLPISLRSSHHTSHWAWEGSLALGGLNTLAEQLCNILENGKILIIFFFFFYFLFLSPIPFSISSFSTLTK